MQGTFKEWSFA